VKRFRPHLTRQEALVQLVILPALATGLAAGTTAVAWADSRTELKYQSTPKDGHKCSDCTLFVPGKSATANGTCKVITGPISPDGWCTAFSRRPA
jgi:hypothetical protein